MAKVKLVPLVPAEHETYLSRWFADQDTLDLMDIDPMPPNELRKWMKAKDKKIFMIQDENGELVGLINFFSIREDDARFGLLIDPAFRGQGYGLSATKQLIPVGFEELGLKSISTYVIKRNVASQKMVERAGFKLERFDPNKLRYMYLLTK